MNPLTLHRPEGLDAAAATGEEETALYHQEFIANPEYTCGEVLQMARWKIHAFVRMQCGEDK